MGLSGIADAVVLESGVPVLLHVWAAYCELEVRFPDLDDRDVAHLETLLECFPHDMRALVNSRAAERAER